MCRAVRSPKKQTMDSAASATHASRDRSFFVANAIVSTLALALLAYLLLLRDTSGSGANLRFMPAVNACWNALAAALLVVGYRAIRAKQVKRHRAAMLGAFAASSVFLVGYLAYHFVHGHTKFAGTGALRAADLVVLASHVLLSVAVVPGALTAFWFAYEQRFERHKRVTRWLWPVWMYVSVTGVLVYALNQLAG